MSLGVIFKGPEGLVLAADSRVTLMGQIDVGGQKMVLPATFDHATKLLQVESQKYVAAVTYGAGAIGIAEPRTAASFLPEFDADLSKKRLSVEAFAERIGKFFTEQWDKAGMPNPAPTGTEMVFLVGGYDENAPYGRIFEVHVPTAPGPVEAVPNFGAIWGGQREIVDRVIQGFDARLPDMVQDILNVQPAQRNPGLGDSLKAVLGLPIPWQFLPLQDCIDLAISMVRMTITLQQWMVGIRGVGGAVDVATITRTDGFTPIQLKQILGEKNRP